MFLYPSHLIEECIVVTREDVRLKDSPSVENKIVHIMLKVQSFIALGTMVFARESHSFDSVLLELLSVPALLPVTYRA